MKLIKQFLACWALILLAGAAIYGMSHLVGPLIGLVAAHPITVGVLGYLVFSAFVAFMCVYGTPEGTGPK